MLDSGLRRNDPQLPRRHSGTTRRAGPGIQRRRKLWIPACAGMTLITPSSFRDRPAGGTRNPAGARMSWIPGLRRNDPHYPVVIPGPPGRRDPESSGARMPWIPACAGMTARGALVVIRRRGERRLVDAAGLLEVQPRAARVEGGGIAPA